MHYQSELFSKELQELEFGVLEFPIFQINLAYFFRESRHTQRSIVYEVYPGQRQKPQTTKAPDDKSPRRSYLSFNTLFLDKKKTFQKHRANNQTMKSNIEGVIMSERSERSSY